MKSGNINGTGRRCPACGEGRLLEKLITERYEHDDRGSMVIVETVDVPIETCDHCGESFTGPKAARIRHEALGRSLGLLTPAEIVAIRRQSGLAEADFARIIGVAEEELSKWERGRSWQDRVVDNLLRILSHVPAAINHLKDEVEIPTSLSESVK